MIHLGDASQDGHTRQDHHSLFERNFGWGKGNVLPLSLSLKPKLYQCAYLAQSG
jgi:hypothetical protein